MYSSGTSGIGTSGAGAATLITLPSTSAMYNRLVIVNTSTTVDGFFSVDGGNTWAYIPKATTTAVGQVESWQQSNSNVLIKRNGGSDMSGVFGFAEWVEGKT